MISIFASPDQVKTTNFLDPFKMAIHQMVNHVYPRSMVNVQKLLKLYSILFWLNFFFFMQLFLKVLSVMANSVDPDQTAPLGAV